MLKKIGRQVWSGEHFGSSLEAGRTHEHIFTRNTVKAKAGNVILKELGVLKGLGIQFVDKEFEKCEATLLSLGKNVKQLFDLNQQSRYGGEFKDLKCPITALNMNVTVPLIEKGLLQ